MITGSCLCGAVQYEYQGEIQEISMCHCAQCRKAQGTAFAAVSPVSSDRLRFTAGAAMLKEFRSTAGKVRVFCAHCGSPIYSARDDLPEIMRLRLGTVDTDIECRHRYHIFAASKAAWDEISDGQPQYDGFKPGA